MLNELLVAFPFYKHDAISVHKLIQISQEKIMVKVAVKKTKERSINPRKVNNQFIKNMLKMKSNATLKNRKTITKEKLQNILKEEMTICPLCLQIMVSPTVTECGHHYCLRCIDSLFSSSSLNNQIPRCPTCRTFLEYYDYHESPSLKILIDKHLQMQDQSSKAAYQQRQKISDTQQQNRMHKQCEVGRKIDYFDYISAQWRAGTIASVYFNEDLVQILSVKSIFDQSGQSRHLRFPVNSRKIASFTYYTRYYLSDIQDSSSSSSSS